MCSKQLNKQSLVNPAGGGISRLNKLANFTVAATKPLLLVRYLAILTSCLAVIGLVVGNVYRHYSYSNSIAGAEPGDAASVLSAAPDGAARLTLTINDATGGADTSAANVSFNTPRGGGVATGRHTINVWTNSVAGYTVTLSGANDDTALRSVDDSGNTSSIQPVAATMAAPAVLASNTWGVAIPGRAGFNSETEYSQGLPAAQGGANGGVENIANQATLQQTKYAAVPGASATIADKTILSGNAATTAAGTATNVYYGANTSYDFRAGQYQTNVVYTATAKLPQPGTITNVSPSSYTLGYSTSDVLTINGTNLSGAYQVFIDLDGDHRMSSGEQCTNIDISSDQQISCHINTNYTAKTHSYDVYVYTQASDTPIVATRAFTYINSICRSGDANSDCQVDIDANMIPIRYTGSTTNAQWTSIANAEDANSIGQWYDYRQQKWANAVTVESGKLSKYQGKDTVIDEEDVLGYWVYVPRYSYEVQRLNATDHYVDNSDFSIVFEKTTDLKKSPAASCNPTSPTVSQMWTNGIANNAASNIAAKDYRTGCGLDRSYPSNDVASLNIHDGGTTWTTHPAFTFGDTELNGFWVGKFELTGSQSAPTVKPNEFANISEPIGDFYDTIKSIGQPDTANTGGNGLSLATNQHNLSTYKSNMMKNDEWGATAYLSASQFGARVNKVYNNAARIWYYKDSSGLYQMYKDADGQNVDACYQNVYDDAGNLSQPTVGCFVNSNGDVVNSNGVAMNPNISGHWGGNHTGCGPNNSSGSATAYESCEPNSDHSYQGSIGQLASTTNNVYGIYDMAGADWEYVAANLTTSDNSTQTNSTSYMKNQSNGTYFNLFRTSDGFDRTTAYGANGEGHAPAWSVRYGGANSTNSQPWRVYMYNNDFCQWGSCGGQAMHETKRYQSVNDWYRSWGGDYSYFSNVTNPWLVRGGRVGDGSGAGVFASYSSGGGANVSYSSRAVLAGR